MIRLPLVTALLLLPASLPSIALAADPAASGLVGVWRTKGGAVVSTLPCASGLCLRVETLAPDAPGTIDHNNPDSALRNRPLCRMEIGSGFAVAGTEATNGHIYDPMSGKTYKANMRLDGADTLKLRGYIGFSALGRTETWQRTTVTKPCS